MPPDGMARELECINMVRPATQLFPLFNPQKKESEKGLAMTAIKVLHIPTNKL